LITFYKLKENAGPSSGDGLKITSVRFGKTAIMVAPAQLIRNILFSIRVKETFLSGGSAIY
jgi:hypothetical protein